MNLSLSLHPTQNYMARNGFAFNIKNKLDKENIETSLS